MNWWKRLFSFVEPPTQEQRVEQRVTLTNHAAGPRTVAVEPWASEYVVAPGDSITVVVKGPSGGAAELEESPERSVVFAWSGSTYSVVDSRGQVIDSVDLAVPATPPGMSVRSFVSMMFKPPSG